MIVVPAVDIMDGKCVQLIQGKPGTERIYGDPVTVAKKWEKEGAHMLHVIDLDAAFGEGDNWEIIEKIRGSVRIPIQVGGGIRSEERAREVLEFGMDRIILGTLAVKNPEVVKRLSKDYAKNRIMVAVDSEKGEILVNGWKEKTGIKTLELINQLEKSVFGFLVTDVDREGKLAGIDLKEFKTLALNVKTKILASGGITSQKDIENLRKVGVWGCVVGKALYEGKINPEVLTWTL